MGCYSDRAGERVGHTASVGPAALPGPLGQAEPKGHGPRAGPSLCSHFRICFLFFNNSRKYV
jgi:hypothetical protein